MADEEKRESEVSQMPAAPKLEQEKELFSWKAPSRPFKRRDREFWVTVGAIAFIFGLILYFAEGVMPVILIIAVVFLYYVMATVEPEIVEYAITNKGVKFAGKTTAWGVLTRFWFTSRLNSKLLVFEMITLPGRLELVINEKDQDALRKVLLDYVIEEEAPPSGLDKAANYISEKLPLKK